MDVPIINTMYSGTISPKNPYITVDNAHPPTEADCINPRMALRFS